METQEGLNRGGVSIRGGPKKTMGGVLVGSDTTLTIFPFFKSDPGKDPRLVFTETASRNFFGNF
jgi:hypothetical protein